MPHPGFYICDVVAAIRQNIHIDKNGIAYVDTQGFGDALYSRTIVPGKRSEFKYDQDLDAFKGDKEGDGKYIISADKNATLDRDALANKLGADFWNSHFGSSYRTAEDNRCILQKSLEFYVSEIPDPKVISYFKSKLEWFGKDGVLNKGAQAAYLDSIDTTYNRSINGVVDNSKKDNMIKEERQSIFEKLKDTQGDVNLQAAAIAFAKLGLTSHEQTQFYLRSFLESNNIK